MTEYPRAPFDEKAYLERVRAACFICELLAGNPDYPHHVIQRDGTAIVFASRMPWLWGHLLVAPVRHREQVVGDFEPDEYLALQRIVYETGRALTAEVPTERLYVLSLGSQQGNRHVHWHLAPLPPGVPYERQQAAALSMRDGYVDPPGEAVADLAERIRVRLSSVGF